MSLDKQNTPFVYTDEQLIARFQNGDERAYIELVNRYRDRLINFVFQFLGDREQSEDVVQDTMLKLYVKKTLLSRDRQILNLALYHRQKSC